MSRIYDRLLTAGLAFTLVIGAVDVDRFNRGNWRSMGDLCPSVDILQLM